MKSISQRKDLNKKIRKDITRCVTLGQFQLTNMGLQMLSVGCMMFLAVAVICISTALSDSTQETYWFRNHEFDDVISTDHVMSPMSNAKSKVNCGTECTQCDTCASFSYNGHNSTCRLYSATPTHTASFLPSLGSRYYTLKVNCPTEDGYVLLADPKICFKVFRTTRTRTDARDFCNQSGTRLVVLDTKEKNEAVSYYIRENIGNLKLYIGLSDIDHEGDFIWENGNPANFTSWKTGEPNNSNNNEDCVLVLAQTAQWNDLPCTREKAYICEKPI